MGALGRLASALLPFGGSPLSARCPHERYSSFASRSNSSICTEYAECMVHVCVGQLNQFAADLRSSGSSALESASEASAVLPYWQLAVISCVVASLAYNHGRWIFYIIFTLFLFSLQAQMHTLTKRGETAITRTHTETDSHARTGLVRPAPARSLSLYALTAPSHVWPGHLRRLSRHCDPHHGRSRLQPLDVRTLRRRLRGDRPLAARWQHPASVRAATTHVRIAYVRRVQAPRPRARFA